MARPGRVLVTVVQCLSSSAVWKHLIKHSDHYPKEHQACFWQGSSCCGHERQEKLSPILEGWQWLCLTRSARSVEPVQNTRRLNVVFTTPLQLHTDLMVTVVPVQVLDINLVLFGNSREIKQTLSRCMGTVHKLHFLCCEFLLLKEPTG